MNRIMKCAALVAVMTVGLGLQAANTWYVDASAPTGGNGSEASPYRTIQSAIDASATKAGDTILVKPGVYAEGGKKYGDTPQVARLYVNKSLHVKSTDGKDVTHIVGNPARGASEDDGSGGPVSCVMSDAVGNKFEGFTFRDGTACANCGAAGGVGAGGDGYTTNRYTMIDCVVSNCIGKIGAMYSGVAVRCLFANNYGYEQATVKMASLYNCLLVDQTNRCFVTKNCGPIVNCTIINNNCSQSTYVDSGNVKSDGAGHYYNCVIYGNGSAFKDANGVYHNCFVDGNTYAAASENVTQIARDGNNPFVGLYMSPLMGDYRPVKDGSLDGAGDDSLYPADVFPPEYQWCGFDGKALTPGSSIPAGVLLSAAVPATAPLAQTAGYKFKFNGRVPVCSGFVHQTDTWPTQTYVEPTDGDTDSMMALSFQPYGSAANTHHWFNGGRGVWVTLPPVNPTLGTVQLYAQACSKRLYVDCNLADYTGHDGSTWANAFKTIQEAVTAAGSSPTWIRVKGGTYAEGEGEYSGLGKARVVVNASVAILIEGVDGADATTIVGDSTHRCMILSGVKVGVAGFTFKDGYGSDYGGGVYARNTYITVQDCTFTGCSSGKNSGASEGATLVRCLFESNKSPSGISRDGYSVACLYQRNLATTTRGARSMYSAHAGFNCTIYDPDAGVQTVMNSDTRLFNTVIAASGNLSESTAILAGNVVNPLGLVSSASGFTADQFLFVDPLLANEADGDFRPSSTSPVFGAGVLEASGMAPEVLCRYITCDYDNNPVVQADGSVASGAFTLAREIRRYYADAASGDDTADGLTEATARKTLAKAMEQPLLGGDEVVALPGIYAEGSQLHAFKANGGNSSTPTIRSRVLVPSGVTLCSRDGAETTVIEGAAATSGADAYGRGADAIRGAAIAKGGRVRGFTIRGGRTAAADNAYTDDQAGGGVIGQSYTYSYVDDCIFTNNVSSCGGGASFANCSRCRFVGNKAPRFGSAVRYGSLYNCFFSDNAGPRVTEVLYDCVNCTYCDNYALDGTSATPTFQNMGDCANLANVLVCGAVVTYNNSSGNDLKAKKIRNCVFPSVMGVVPGRMSADAVGLDMTHSLAELRAMFADGYPVSKDVVTVDTGFALDSAGDRDVLGAVRVQNGTVDIGAFEYDWLGDYGKALGMRVTVTSAENVVETGNAVTLSGGAVLVASWAMSADGSAPDCRCSISATLTGEGTLYVYLNGSDTPVGTLTSTGTVRFDNALARNDVVLKYVGDGTAALARFRREMGLMLFIR